MTQDDLTLRAAWPATSRTASSFHRVLTINDRAIIVRGPDPKSVLELRGYKTTSLGAEAFSLCPMPAPPEYVQAVAEQCKSNGFDVAIASCRTDLPGTGRLELFDEVAI